MTLKTHELLDTKLSLAQYKEALLDDYRIVYASRVASLMGRKEVLTGYAQFGIFGDGKELPQVAMAKVFRNGDFRSGYYRDQTFMFAIGAISIGDFFAQLYSNTDSNTEPQSAGRQMNNHFSTHLVDENGQWKNATKMKNSVSDISTTSGQIPRLLGLAQASKIYRKNPYMKEGFDKFSDGGNEVIFGTIGNGACAEGQFFETLNAIAIAQVPVILSVWDDHYAISVTNDKEMVKSDVSEALKGFQRTETSQGIEIIKVKGWDYPALINAYKKADELARDRHIPVLVHVVELTQPQGHSTSGSHERYKSEERLQWEEEFDGIARFKKWMLSLRFDHQPIVTEYEFDTIEQEIKQEVKLIRKEQWESFQAPNVQMKGELIELLQQHIIPKAENHDEILTLVQKLDKEKLFRRDVLDVARRIWRTNRAKAYIQPLSDWVEQAIEKEKQLYGSYLYSQSEYSPLNISEVSPTYEENAPMVDGRLVLHDNFDVLFDRYPEVLTFGEDTGKIGGVNQCFEGLQEKYGELRVGDTGIHETAIIGTGIGLAMRGLRPIAEIQYLDYIFFASSSLTDDLATLHYRTAGRQKAPLIIRTRGHRLVGIWHAGSPMGALLNMLRGVHVLVPRDMTRAAGFYNTLIQSDDPALVVEPLNGYRLKEKMPSNLGTYTTPLGKVEVTRTGKDVTMVTYGSTWRVVMQAAEELATMGIDAEVIDLQSLLPFDLTHEIKKSLMKTNHLVIVDEDVPSGASAFILQKVLEDQKAFYHLDSEPLTIAAAEHRTPTGIDGDYYAKPQVEGIVDQVYSLMKDTFPQRFT